MVFIAVSFVLLGMLLFLLWVQPKYKKMLADDEILAARYRQRRQGVLALSANEARQQAEVLLEDPQKFSCSQTLLPLTDAFNALAPSIQSFFLKFESVQITDGEALLSRDLIAPFGWDWKEGPWHKHQFWQIGSDHEHVVILVKPHEEGIYATDGLDIAEELEAPDYPTIYHWLLMVATD